MGIIITPCETARRYRNFTRPSEVMLYSDSPYIHQFADLDYKDLASQAGEQTFARTRSGHFIAVDFTGESFGNPCHFGIEKQDTLLLHELPAFAKHTYCVTTPEIKTPAAFVKDGRMEEIQKLYEEILKTQGWMNDIDFVNLYKEDFKFYLRRAGKSEEIMNDIKPDDIADQKSQNYEVEMMTEEYRSFFVREMHRRFGDPSKEISGFCGVPYEKEDCFIEMDARKGMIDMAMSFSVMSKESTDDKCEDIVMEYLMDDLKRLGFDDSNWKVIKFAMCNPTFMPYILWLTQGKPLCTCTFKGEPIWAQKWLLKVFVALFGAIIAMIAGLFFYKY